MNSWNAEYGAMSYDDEAPSFNATCPQCQRDYHRDTADDGWLCDTCCSLRDLRLKERTDQAYTAAVRTWFRRTDVA